MTCSLTGYARSDGRKGVRNVLLVAYLVECAHHVAREIVVPYRDAGAQLIGFPGCYPNDYAQTMMQRLCTHPNVGAVLLVGLGCESFDRRTLAGVIRDSGRATHELVIQECGGTRRTIDNGRQWVEAELKKLARQSRVEMDPSELCIGTICGGSDAFSGLTANPTIGRAFDGLVGLGATCIFEETGELIGCEQHMADRAVTPALGQALIASAAKAERYYRTLGHGSFAPGNATGGLTTQEEKNLGAYAKSGTSQIAGLLKPGDIPPRGGLYLLDVVPDGEVRFGFPNINDNTEIAELIACGAHVILFSTGRGSVVGSAISPVVKVCSNPQTYHRMKEDMDLNAGAIIEEGRTLDDLGHELIQVTLETAAGAPTASETLGHQEFILGYKHFEPLGPACLPVLTH